MTFFQWQGSNGAGLIAQMEFIGFIRVNGKFIWSYWTNGKTGTTDRYIKLHSGRRVHVRPGDYVIFEGSKLYRDLDYLPDYTGTLQLEIE